jgi:protein gp37
MAQNSNIEWTDHTFNAWIGCTKVSPGCANCYAEARDQRFAGGAHWGKGAPRQRTSAANWKQPLRWNRQAVAQQVELDNRRKAIGAPLDVCWIARRPRVFCASLADWLDAEVPIEWLADLLSLIHATPFLDWQLLTKRPENWKARIEAAADSCPEREMRSTPAQYGYATLLYRESGPHARPMHPAWARSLRDQCQAAHVPFMFKQWGSWVPSGSRRLPDRLGWKFGKKAAGRKLDGREWNEFPR